MNWLIGYTNRIRVYLQYVVLSGPSVQTCLAGRVRTNGRRERKNMCREKDREIEVQRERERERERERGGGRFIERFSQTGRWVGPDR